MCRARRCLLPQCRRHIGTPVPPSAARMHGCGRSSVCPRPIGRRCRSRSAAGWTTRAAPAVRVAVCLCSARRVGVETTASRSRFGGPNERAGSNADGLARAVGLVAVAVRPLAAPNAVGTHAFPHCPGRVRRPVAGPLWTVPLDETPGSVAVARTESRLAPPFGARLRVGKAALPGSGGVLPASRRLHPLHPRARPGVAEPASFAATPSFASVRFAPVPAAPDVVETPGYGRRGRRGAVRLSRCGSQPSASGPVGGEWRSPSPVIPVAESRAVRTTGSGRRGRSRNGRWLPIGVCSLPQHAVRRFEPGPSRRRNPGVGTT